MTARDLALRVYAHLPPTLAPIAATARGWYLRRWRYGADTPRVVAEALARETWTAGDWNRWRGDRLARVLSRAATRVPYYRRFWDARRRDGDARHWDRLEHWPILEKREVRDNPRDFLADDCDPRSMFHEHTSGTTGQSLDLWWSRRTVRDWYALLERRGRQWYGVSRETRWAILGGQLVAPATRRRPPFWVWNRALNQLYMSAYHLAPDFTADYIRALRAYRIEYVWGYSSALYELARTALSLNLTPPKMRVAITNAEPLFDYQRRAISEAFSCPVRETYGMAEIVSNASECEAGALHTWPEVGITEVVDGTTPVPDGIVGDLVCTGLLNDDMPLIRYRVGDRGRLTATDSPCACGRTLPRLEAIEGRTDDTLYTRDGRRIGRLDPVFKAGLPIVEAQILQDAFERVRVRFVPESTFGRSHAARLTDEIRARLGPIDVVLEPVPSIPRTRNGKFRAVICNLDPASHVAQGPRS